MISPNVITFIFYLPINVFLGGDIEKFAPLIGPLCGQQAAEIAFGRQLGEKSPPGEAYKIGF